MDEFWIDAGVGFLSFVPHLSIGVHNHTKQRRLRTVDFRVRFRSGGDQPVSPCLDMTRTELGQPLGSWIEPGDQEVYYVPLDRVPLPPDSTKSWVPDALIAYLEWENGPRPFSHLVPFTENDQQALAQHLFPPK